MASYFLYARRSSEDDDRQVASIPAQLAELHQCALQRGITIRRVFEESMSARKPGRPVFAEMIREAERHPVAGILCWKADRLARNALDGGRIIDALDRHRIGEVVTPGRIFKNTGDDKMMLSIEFSFSKKYVDDLADNVRRGNRRVLSSGRWPGVVPLGYVKGPKVNLARGRGAGRTLSDAERLPLVRELFHRYLTGRYSVSELCEIADHKLGLRTRGSRRYPARPLPITTMFQILRNPFYAGLLVQGGDVYPGDHEPIITKAEHDEVLRLLADRGTPRPKRREFTYRGLLHCGHCGRGTTAEHHVNRFGTHYDYYRCTRRPSDAVGCPRPWTNERVLEAAIDAQLQRLDIPAAHVDWALEWAASEERALRKAQSAAIEATRGQLREKDAEIERLTTLCLRGAFSDDEFVARKETLVAERLALEARIADPVGRDAAVIGRLRETIRLAAEARDAFSTGTADARREIAGGVFAEIALTADGPRPTFAKPFALLAGSDSPGTDPPGSNPRAAASAGPSLLAETATTDGAEPGVGAPSPRAGSNPAPARRNRASGAVRTMSFSTWCTRVKDVRTLLLSGWMRGPGGPMPVERLYLEQ